MRGFARDGHRHVTFARLPRVRGFAHVGDWLMVNASTSIGFREFLAKSNHPTAPTDWRTLEQHSLDVASALRVLLGSPVLRDRCAVTPGQPLDAAAVDTLSVLAMLHDLGKADARWQAYIRGTGARRDHTAPFLVHLGTTPPLYEALRPALALVDDEEAMLLTVVAHHGAPITEEALRRYRGRPDEVTDAAAIAETHRLVEPALPTLPADQADRMDFGLQPRLRRRAHARRLARLLDRFQTGSRPRSHCRRRAGDHRLASVHHGRRSRRRVAESRPGQAAVLGAPLDDRLVLLEDSTGSGKTEAAIIRALALIDAGLVEGLYFAVPTRSAATELHARIAKIVTGVHPGQAGRVMRVIPTALDTDDLLPGQARSWAAGSSKKATVAPIGVGTIDQALLSIMRVRHSWLRRAALRPSSSSSTRFMLAMPTCSSSRRTSCARISRAVGTSWR